MARPAISRRPRGRWARWYSSAIDDKRDYDDRQFRAFASLIALGAERDGWWRSRATLDDRLGADMVDFLIDRRDLVVRRSGRVEIVGWATYQRPGRERPGASTARVRRYRERRAAEGAGENVDVTLNETLAERSGNASQPVDPRSMERTVSRPFRARFPISLSYTLRSTDGDGEDHGDSEPDVARAREGPDVDEPEAPLLAWLAGHHATVMPTGNGYHRTLVGLAERHPVGRIVEAFAAAEKRGARTPRQFVFAATNLLDAVPPMTDARREAVDEERRREIEAASRRRTEATRRRIEELRSTTEDEPARRTATSGSPAAAGHARLARNVRPAANAGGSE